MKDLIFSVTFILLYANAFDFDQSKQTGLVKSLSICRRQIQGCLNNQIC